MSTSTGKLLRGLSLPKGKTLPYSVVWAVKLQTKIPTPPPHKKNPKNKKQNKTKKQQQKKTKQKKN